jgi:hypothetical protein
MKKVILATLLTLSFTYAVDAQMELEHAIKTGTSSEGTKEDMSKMKAAGKCNADQVAKVKTKAKEEVKSEATKSATELEHAVKSATSAEGVAEDMSKMKAAGKCGGK